MGKIEWSRDPIEAMRTEGGKGLYATLSYIKDTSRRWSPVVTGALRSTHRIETGNLRNNLEAELLVGGIRGYGTNGFVFVDYAEAKHEHNYTGKDRFLAEAVENSRPLLAEVFKYHMKF